MVMIVGRFGIVVERWHTVHDDGEEIWKNWRSTDGDDCQEVWDSRKKMAYSKFVNSPH